MADEQAMRKKFWKALEDDMTVMLGLSGVEEGHSRPMTAQLDDTRPGPIWFFTAKNTELVKALSQTQGNATQRAVAHFAAKGHELFASIHGELTLDNDRATVDRLWNRFVAVWYQGGKDDPQLQLLRLDPEHAQIWLNEHSVFAGVKLLLGVDPKRSYQDKVADVRLPH
jgi:general stress protein 26